MELVLESHQPILSVLPLTKDSVSLATVVTQF